MRDEDLHFKRKHITSIQEQYSWVSGHCADGLGSEQRIEQGATQRTSGSGDDVNMSAEIEAIRGKREMRV